MRPEPRCSSWETIATGRLSHADDARLKRVSRGLLGRRPKFWSRRWSPLACVAVAGSVLVAFLLLLCGILDWPLSTALQVVGLATFVQVVLVGAWSFGYTPPAMTGLALSRTRLFRRALRAGCRRELGTLGPRLGAEFARRRIAWVVYLTGSASHVRKLRMIHYDRWSRTLLYASIAANAIAPVGQLVAEAVSPALTLLPALLGWFGFFCIYLRLRFVLRRAGGSIARSSCPDCGYPLREVPSAIDPALCGNVHIGPARCPECGCPWPLVPPEP